MTRIIMAISVAILLQGCISTHEVVSITTAFPFEKRYTSKDTIIVNGEKIEFPRNKSIWILSNDTLDNLLIYSNGKEVKK